MNKITILMIVIGLKSMAAGKLEITRSLVLVGSKARWYGFTMFLTAIPLTLVFQALIAAMMPVSILAHPVLGKVINFGLLIAYSLLLARRFRESGMANIHRTPVAAGQ